MRVLISGGCGFVGSHIVHYLLADGHKVVVVDNLAAQVHGFDTRQEQRLPYYLSHIPGMVEEGDFRFYCGDIGNIQILDTVFRENEIDSIIHLAALVGVGQSQYEIWKYIRDNVSQTGSLLQHLRDNKWKGRLVVASSMSVYGDTGDTPACEDMFPRPPNIYAETKYNQERYCLLWGEITGNPVTALRFFNIYGPHQSLKNPYTGVCAIFAACLMTGRGGIIYEDGLQKRDFIHVDDVSRGVLHFVDPEYTPQPVPGVFNLGTGFPVSVLDLYSLIGSELARHDREYIEPTITGISRVGDIRGCYASMDKTAAVGFVPIVPLQEGMRRYVDYLVTVPEKEVHALSEKAHSELEAHGLLK